MSEKRNSTESPADPETRCNIDPRYTAELLLKAHDGDMSQDGQLDLRAHLEQCPRCKEDYESLTDFEMEMLIATHDENELRRFDPEPMHAERCLLTTRQRLERLAQGVSEPEVIGDDELEKHIDECVYCRRRSISAARRARYPERLLLVYRLSDETLTEALNGARQKVWHAVTTHVVPPVRLAARTGGALILSSGVSLEPHRFARTLDICVSNLPGPDGRKILLVSAEGSEISSTLNADGLAQFIDVPDGKYFVFITGIVDRLILVLAEEKAEAYEHKGD